MLKYIHSGEEDYAIYKHLIPTQIQLEELLQKNKPNFKYRIDFFRHLIELTIKIPAKNKSLRRSNGFAPLNAKLLQRQESNYRRYLDYLVSNGVLEEDPSYLKNEYSRSFRISEKLLSEGLTEVIISDKRLLRNMDSEYSVIRADRIKYKYLLKWFDNRLQVDYQKALEHCLKNLHLNIHQDAYEKYRVAYGKLWKLNQIKNGCFWFKTDKFGKRLHTNLTNLNSDLFQFLSYNGEPLVALDIKNSQPYFSIGVVAAENGKKGQSIHNTTHPSYSIMLLESSERLASIDFQLYKRLVSEGKFYEFMEERVREEIGEEYFTAPFIYDFETKTEIPNRKLPRERIKGDMFVVFFSKNSTEHPIKAVFQKYFPSVAKVFQKIKSNKHIPYKDRHSQLAKLLQRLEANSVLDLTCKIIAKERPDLPLFTVHDCIITTKGNEDYVHDMIMRCLTDAIGTKPRLHFKHLNKSDNEQYQLLSAA